MNNVLYCTLLRIEGIIHYHIFNYSLNQIVATWESNPTLSGFNGMLSPSELYCHKKYLYRWIDSNHQPPAYQTSALTNCATSVFSRADDRSRTDSILITS